FRCSKGMNAPGVPIRPGLVYLPESITPNLVPPCDHHKRTARRRTRRGGLVPLPRARRTGKDSLRGAHVDVLNLARWQFGITTVYHFLMVPLTIGLSLLVAGMQTAWVRTGNEKYLKMTKFWGKLLLINFAMGVVTGIVQEFQFGMNWNEYARFVGDVFGAPLAMEGLLAFFVESTFLGLWLFGWDRLPKKVHLACAWAFSLATMVSAYFILAANSWMQHPVGVRFVDGKPQMTSIGDVLTNSTLLAAYPHTIAGAFAVAGAFLVGIGVWWLWRRRNTDDEHRPVWRASIKLGAWVGAVSFVVLLVSGDW